jgi:chromatin remodeling complex protein RSC6
MKPMQPSSDLASVVGSSPMPRTEVTKKLWQYIKRKGLQDSKNRRMINADENLRPIFGGSRQVSMFEMTRLVNKHLKNT